MRATLLGVLFPSSILLAQVTDQQFAAIKKEGLEHSRVMAHLDHLVNRIGPRLTSSDNLTDACEWARDTFASFGIDNARLEQWGTFPVGFNRGPWFGRMTKPESMELVFNTQAWTAGTNKPSRGPLVMAPKDADELAKTRGFLANTWLLMPPRTGGRMTAEEQQFRQQLTAALEQGGGFGLVTGAGGRSGDLLLTGGQQTADFAKLPTVPSVQLRADCYEKVAKFLADNISVEVEFDIRNHFKKGPIELYNVLADIPGTALPDEYVVVSGHLDSWDGATGTTDNGTGTATTIEAARILMAIGAKPRRTIRFMLWSGEEQGLLGSRAWVNKHKDEMTKYSACLVHDGGTNYLAGIAGMKEMHPQLQTVFAPVLALNPDMPFAIRDIEAFTPIGSDHESFTAAGVPGFFWDQKGRANYTHTHHTQYDTFDAAIPEYQMHSSVVIAIGALGIANLPDLLTRENMKVNNRFGGGGAARGGAGAPGGRRLGVLLDEDVGTTITEVTDDGLAKKAGLKAGDVVLRIGSTAIKGQGDVRDAITNGPAKTTVTVKRDGKELTVEVTFDQ